MISLIFSSPSERHQIRFRTRQIPRLRMIKTWLEERLLISNKSYYPVSLEVVENKSEADGSNSGIS